MMSALLIAALLAVTVFPTMALASNAKVNSSSARVYKSASTSSASVKMKKGTKLTVKSVSGQWAKVSLNGHTGYMPVKYLNSKNRAAAYVNKGTYIYASASTSSGCMPKRLLSPDVNQQIVTDHPAAFSQGADITVPRPPAGLWPVPLTTAHVRSSDFVQSTAQYCQVRIRTASPGSLSVQESRFVNFVGVRVKARP